MTDRPMIFSAPMVRALLEGRKTQTRRVIKPVSVSDSWPGEMWPVYLDGRRLGERSGYPEMVAIDCDGGSVIWDGPVPYVFGDKLWVKETWQAENARPAFYRADGGSWPGKWRSPIFMPRWASRLTLVVTDVRVQRLQEISEADAEAEGIDLGSELAELCANISGSGYANDLTKGSIELTVFRDLWDSINAARGFGWDTNPWVCALTFDVHHCNIDQMEKAA